MIVPLMPEGVEHMVKTREPSSKGRVIVPLMPEGVEHKVPEAKPVMVAPCDRPSDAGRR